MKFKDYLQSLVSRRKSIGSSNRPEIKLNHSINKPVENGPFVDCHYDVCGYEDVNNLLPDDQHSRTHILLARHAELVSNIVESRSALSQETNVPHSCMQCRISNSHSSNVRSPMPPPPPPPLPPKLIFDQSISLFNRNYSSTLATCSPRRECQQMTSMKLINSQYSTPNPSVISSSSGSLWTTSNTSRKQRSRIRTNPWIATNLNQNRTSAFIESPGTSHTKILHNNVQPEYSIYDPTFQSPNSGLIHSESFPQTVSNSNIHLITSNVQAANAPKTIIVPTKSTKTKTSSTVLHRSDSGHGYSLSSSRMINSSSLSSSASSSSSSASPPSSLSSSAEHTNHNLISTSDQKQNREKKSRAKNTSTSSNVLINGNSKRLTKIDGCFRANTIGSESLSSTERTKGYRVSPPISYQYTRSNLMNKTRPHKVAAADRFPHQHSTSSSSRSIDDHFSIEFEEILESERSCKQRKDRSSTNRIVSPTLHSPRKSPFILPLEETNMKLSSPSTTMPSGTTVFTPNLTKTNSRAILRHIEEIENEIRMIKNLDLDENDDENEEFFISPHAYPEEDFDFDDVDQDQMFSGLEPELSENTPHPSIFEQVDQWVERCLQTTNKPNNPATRLHNECDQISKTIQDYVGFVYNGETLSNEKMLAQPESLTPELVPDSLEMESSKRTSSLINRSSRTKDSSTVTSSMKIIHECPF